MSFRINENTPNAVIMSEVEIWKKKKNNVSDEI